MNWTDDLGAAQCATHTYAECYDVPFDRENSGCDCEARDFGSIFTRKARITDRRTDPRRQTL